MMERYSIQRSVPALLVALLFLATLLLAFIEVGFGDPRVDDEDAVSNRYIEDGVNETGSSNLVTSVVVNYRGFDTLGEVTVLFLAASGVGALISILPEDKRKKNTEKIPPSFIVQMGARLIMPLIILFGVYVFIHGHLSPGGGFQGGVIIGSGILLYMIAFPDFKPSKKALVFSESLAGLTFAGIGIVGLAISGIFLDNVIHDAGEIGTLVSGGLLPIIYIAIGIKVGSELTGLVSKMRGDAS